MVVAVTVAIVLAIGLVVLVVIRNEIVQVEAIMCSDEIDARPRPAAALVEEGGGSREALGQILHRAGVALPESTRRVAEFVVPLSPTVRELSNLITPGTNVPWFGNQ